MYPFKDTGIEIMLSGRILASDRRSNDNTLHIAELSLVLRSEEIIQFRVDFQTLIILYRRQDTLSQTLL